MTYIVAKQMKSRGVAFVLVFLFGPLGVFYSSITGGLVMTIAAPILVFVFLGIGAAIGSKLIITAVIIFCLLYYVICFIWAIRAVEKYNNNSIEEANLYNNSYGTAMNASPIIITVPIGNNSNQGLQKLNEDLEALNEEKISINDYYAQKNIPQNKIEILEPSNSTSKVYAAQEQMPIAHNNNSKKNTWIWLWVLLLIISFLFFLYDSKTNSFRLNKVTSIFSFHSKDKEEIKEQLENAYSNVLNGTYTTQNILNTGAGGLPFYNANLKSLMLVGLAPFAQLGGNDFKIEPSNIDTYDFIDNDNTAKLSYDLTIINESDTVKSHVDMLVKKIGGVWKFDANDFFGVEKINSHGIDKNKNEKTSEIIHNEKPKSEMGAFNNVNNQNIYGSNKFSGGKISLPFRINKNIFDDLSSEYPKYQKIKDADIINSLLTENLKRELNLNKSQSFPIDDDYTFYNIGTANYKNLILQFWGYQYHGLGDQLYIYLNITNSYGIILDSKMIGKDAYDGDADNTFSTTTCVIDEMGQIILKSESQNGTNSSINTKIEKDYIDSGGKIKRL